MTAGETRRLWIPANLAYGERPPPGAPGGQLCFDVTLYSFKASPKPPSVPVDVAAVPADAVVTSTGLASRMLKAGSGGAKPKATDRVTVNYSGWTTNGKMFDSSIPTVRWPHLCAACRAWHNSFPPGTFSNRASPSPSHSTRYVCSAPASHRRSDLTFPACAFSP
jgi:hypothetical protein